MGKFQLRKPKIISKNFPEVGSHIDNVSKSLNDLVFNYSAQVDKALQKKHMMMALSTLVLILVVGNFISPKGRADIATFYPETCLGGWSNPQNAQKEPQTTSNADLSQFDDKNSAILDKNTHADIYCGNFNGKFDEGTQPTKIIVSFAMTNKDEITVGTISTTTLDVVATSTATSTDLQAPSTESLQLATSTEGTSTAPTVPTSDTVAGTETQDVATTTKEKEQTFVDIVTEAVSETISNLFNSGTPGTTETDTVVVPPQVEQPVPQEPAAPTEQPPTEQPAEQPVAAPAPESSPEATAPTSYLDSIFRVLSTSFITTVFAQEEAVTVDIPVETAPSNNQSVSTATSATVADISEPVPPVVTETAVDVSGSTTEVVASTTLETSTSTATSTDGELLVASSSLATSTDSELLLASSSLLTDIATATTSSMTEAADVQNNFLEVLYTFDGVTWVSLGELNEISMKYRTFEIPLSASSTWSDMSQLQIKVASKSVESETPVTYLDAIKVEVLYESSLLHSHPDFVRDTIVKDETIDGMRLVTIINSETNEEETWYMYLDEEVTVATSTDVASTTMATSTETQVEGETSSATSTRDNDSAEAVVADISASSTLDTLTLATSSDSGATSTATSSPAIVPVIQKNKWFKLVKKEEWATLSARELVEEIKKSDKEELDQKEKEDRLPDFSVDVIKKIRGTHLNIVIIQLKKEGKEELWLYNLENGEKEKLSTGSSTTIAEETGVGMKGDSLFWVSEDKTKVVAYNLVTKLLQERGIPPYDFSVGERGRVLFEDLGWEVIIDTDKLLFYSEATGEVFSDDNGSLVEALRQKLELDKVLDADEMSDLNFPVTEDTSKEPQ